MSTAHRLLVRATGKLLELRTDPQWAEQFPARCPPVLWFGNSASPKPKVLTIGANPSRQEFLGDSAEEALKNVRCMGDESLLRYLEPPHHRFRVLRSNETLDEVLRSETLRDQIIASYDGYFRRDPYTKWFGDDKGDSHRVEGFLRGFGASYYDGGAVPLQAIHVDLFPFATLNNFGELVDTAERDLFKTDWAEGLLGELIEFLAPTALIVFGKTNYGFFGKYIDTSVLGAKQQPAPFRPGKYYLTRSSSRFGIPVVGLSTNLGDPRRFFAHELKAYGSQIREELAGKLT